MGDGIARIIGLGEIMSGELVEFAEGTRGIALNLESKNVGIVLMGAQLIIGKFAGSIPAGCTRTGTFHKSIGTGSLSMESHPSSIHNELVWYIHTIT